MAMDNSNSFNALTQAHPGRSAADYRMLQTLLTIAVTSIPKKPYLKATLRKLDQTERKFRDFCINTLGMLDVSYSTDAVILYIRNDFPAPQHHHQAPQRLSLPICASSACTAVAPLPSNGHPGAYLTHPRPEIVGAMSALWRHMSLCIVRAKSWSIPP
ncbi:hypothetical protein BGX38DRAFT_705677 [Terfezia claveryi]|nr:hypothetical protein BGX38DRAFT_705677 [Terfezia claveryi]